MSEPLYILARVDRPVLISNLALQRVVVVPNEHELVICSDGLLKVDVPVFKWSLVQCGCMRVICYQYVLKSRNQAYWWVVDALCLSVSFCAENEFHISRSCDGVDEGRIDHICLFEGLSMNCFARTHRYLLLKDIANGFGGCERVTLTVYATLVQVMKRHGILNLNVPKSIRF